MISFPGLFDFVKVSLVLKGLMSRKDIKLEKQSDMFQEASRNVKVKFSCQINKTYTLPAGKKHKHNCNPG